jgi:hypothetical protein
MTFSPSPLSRKGLLDGSVSTLFSADRARPRLNCHQNCHRRDPQRRARGAVARPG